MERGSKVLSASVVVGGVPDAIKSLMGFTEERGGG